MTVAARLASSVFEVIAFELRAYFSSRRAYGTAAFLIMVTAVPLAPPAMARFHGDPNAGTQMARTQARFLMRAYDADVASALVGCPPGLVAVVASFLLFMPLIVLMVGFDCVSREVREGSCRYTLARVGPTVWLSSKMAALWLTSMAVVMVTALLQLAILGAQGMPSAHASWAARLLVVPGVALFPYCALVVFVSAMCEAAVSSLLLGVSSLMTLLVTGGLAAAENLDWLRSALPATVDRTMLASLGSLPALAGGVAAMWAVALLAGAAVRFRLGEI